MNKWECMHTGCDSVALGVGSAVGLVAIGWYFRPGTRMRGPILFCPFHRPDPFRECVADPPADRRPGPCSLCRAEQEMREWQRAMMRVYGYDYEP